MWKFERQFRKDNTQTKGETDKYFDLDNYKDWLEAKLQETIEIKNLYRASYGGENRIMFILARSLDEAIILANATIIDETFGLEFYDEENDKEYLPFIFDKESVIELDLKQSSQIIVDLTADSF
jgi:hypothetical protein